MLLQHAGEGEHVADVVVHDQHLLSVEARAAADRPGRRGLHRPGPGGALQGCAAAAFHGPAAALLGHLADLLGPVVGRVLADRNRQADRGHPDRGARRLGVRPGQALDGGPLVARAGLRGLGAQRQVERERGARAQLALGVDLAAEQPGDLAADRQAEAGTAVLAAGGAVGLLERLEDLPQLVAGDTDAGVGDGEGDQLVVRALDGAGLQQSLAHVRRDLPAGRADREVDGARVGELHRVGDQVAQHLLEPLLVGVQGDRQGGRDPDGEVQVLVQRDRLEGGLHVVDQLDQGDPGRADVHLAGLDLGQVEDVVDQLEQVGAGAVDGVGELDLLGREVALVVVGEQLGQDQQRVERGAQLVRHVGEELALVPGGQGELFGALLQDLPGLLDLAVLDLDVAVLLGELLGLLLQLLVGALQFLLACFQLG